jgi:hypothetical protein
LFFEKVRDRFIKELQYLKDETAYKILWAMFKAEQITAHSNDFTWQLLRDQIITKAKTMKPKYLTDIIVLTTKQKSDSDFFDKLEPVLTSKMREMAIEDLINLLWSALRIAKGSHYFYDRLEEEIGRRIMGVKDD